MEAFLQHFDHAGREAIRWKLFTFADVDGPMAGYKLNGIPLSKRSFQLLFGSLSVHHQLDRGRAEHIADLPEAEFDTWLSSPRGYEAFRAIAGADAGSKHRSRRYRPKRH